MVRCGLGREDVDRGWAWLVLLAAFWSLFISAVCIYGLGVLHVKLLETYNDTEAKTALVGALHGGLQTLVAPLASILINGIGLRKCQLLGAVVLTSGYISSVFVDNVNLLILTLGVVGGIGMDLVLIPVHTAIGYYFDKRKTIAFCISSSGAGCGMFVAAPLMRVWLKNLGLSGALFSLACFSIHHAVVGMILKPVQSRRHVQVENKILADEKHLAEEKTPHCFKKLFSLDVLTDKAFVFFLVSTIMWCFPLSVCMIHLPNYSRLKGISMDKAALLIAVFGVGNAICRLLVGFIIAKQCIKPMTIQIASMGVSGILSLTFPLWSNVYVGQVIYSILIGVFTGALTVLTNILTVDLIGVYRLASALGMTYFVAGVGYFSGPPVAGLILDVTESYDYSFYLVGATFLVGALSALASSISMKKPRTRDGFEKEFENKEEFQGVIRSVISLSVGGLNLSQNMLNVSKTHINASLHHLNSSKSDIHSSSGFLNKSYPRANSPMRGLSLSQTDLEIEEGKALSPGQI